MRSKSHLLNILLLSLLTACSANSSETNSDNQQAKAVAPNFILMIGDDMAVETLSCYQVGDNTATTPNLDQLCDSGVRFDNFWSQPVCSPTRATILTGQYGFTNGVGGPVTGMQGVDWKIPNTETSATNPTRGNAMGMGGNAMGMGGSTNRAASINPSITKDSKTFMQALNTHGGYQTAAVGKWHLANDSNGGLKHPSIVGFDHYSGSIRGGGVTTFSAWSKVINGSDPFGKTGYATTDTIDDGIAWLDKTDSEKPWFLWVAFNAPHTPLHKPPVELLVSDQAKALDVNGPNNGEDQALYFKAMIEAMDTEIGRLLATLDEQTRANTYVVFMGDNGTPGGSVSAPFEREKSKGSVYQGGVNVPMFIAGPGIKGGQSSDALANSVDFFATFLELANVPLDNAKSNEKPFHSVSLTPIFHNNINAVVRDYAYADAFGTIGGSLRNSRAIRNTEYKLIQNLLTDSEELYNLESDPYESINLLKATLSDSDQANYAKLQRLITDLVEK